MGKRLGMLIPAMVLLAACSGSPADEKDPDGDGPNDPTNNPPVDADADGDGLSDDQESDLGLDPAVADTDEDGVDDGAEVDSGTDPLKKDSDSDGYTDGEEHFAGTDALDAGSVIYQGGWPFNMEKGALQNPTFAGSIGAVSVGERFPDLLGIDQFGDLVHLYDFANHGKPVVIDFSAQWCVPCMNLADFMTDGNDSLPYTTLRDAVQSDEVYWITVMGQNVSFGLPTAVTSEEWAADFPDEKIPVIAPPNPAASMHYIDLHYFPTAIWLDEEMTVVAFENDPNPYAALDALEGQLSTQ